MTGDEEARKPGGLLVAAVLAAGRGERFGGAKLARPFGGRPLVAWPVKAALASGLGQVAVVVGFHQDLVRAALPQDDRLSVLPNPNAAQGMGTSLALAAAWAQGLDASGLVLLLGDMPLVSAELIARVGRAAGQAPSGAAAAACQGRRGHPVAFTARHLPELAACSGDQGARELLKRLGEAVALVPAGQECLADVDRPQDLERLEEGR